ncbi:MAG: twin-arginine translocation signal domain-containing protein, partial [Comamonas sp.]
MIKVNFKHQLAEHIAADLGRRNFLGAGLSAAAVAAAGGASLLGPNVAEAAEPKRGGTLKWGQVAQLDTLDP